MIFDIFTFSIVFAIGFMGTLSLSQTPLTLYLGLGATIVIAFLCVFVTPAFATLIGLTIIIGGWKKEGLNQKKHKHLDWGKLDKSNMLVVQEKIKEGISEAVAQSLEGQMEITQTPDTDEDFRERALNQNPFRPTTIKT